MMHALKNWLDCDDPTCKCNEHLAKQPPFKGVVMKSTPGPSKTPRKRPTKAQRERDAERQREWRERNLERSRESARVSQKRRRDRERMERG